MLYLIGVDHSVPHDARAASEGPEFDRLRNEFPAVHEKVAREIGATVIAEESNEDVLNYFAATKSIPSTVASELDIVHMFCEPCITERERLGIHNTGNPADFVKRENFWLGKLSAIKDDVILFVLGVDHVHSFLELAHKHGFSVNVVDKYYGKEYFPPSN